MKAGLPEVVSFDIDGTLVDFLAVLRGALREVGNALESLTGAGASFDELQAFRNGVAAESEYRSARLETIRRESFRRALAGFGADPDRHIDALWRVWSGYRATHHHLYQDVLPTLRWLKDAGVGLVAASNGNTDLSRSEIHPLFDALFYSEKLGASKPDVRFFGEVARRVGADPAAIVHVGDSLPEDYWAALEAGFGAVLLQRAAVSKPEGVFAIRSLADLGENWDGARQGMLVGTEASSRRIT